MTAPAGTYPDSEALLIGWLAIKLDPITCLGELPANLEEVLPVVQVTGLTGSAASRGWNGDRWLTSSPRLDVDCFAATKEQASDLSRWVQGYMAELAGQTTGGAVVATVTEEAGPERRPDFNPRVRRFGATYALTIRPA